MGRGDSVRLQGVRINDWTVVGACAIVTKDVLECKIVAGNPAKVTGG